MSEDLVKLRRRNIEINSERAARHYAEDNHESYKGEVKEFFRKQFINAELERERKENLKRGVK